MRRRQATGVLTRACHRQGRGALYSPRHGETEIRVQSGHSPVAEGDCTGRRDPHQSKAKFHVEGGFPAGALLQLPRCRSCQGEPSTLPSRREIARDATMSKFRPTGNCCPLPRASSLTIGVLRTTAPRAIKRRLSAPENLEELFTSKILYYKIENYAMCLEKLFSNPNSMV